MNLPSSFLLVGYSGYRSYISNSLHSVQTLRDKKE